MDDAITGLALIFVLGLRHGLDPDHIAVVDNMTLQMLSERRGSARWAGALFSLGHSLSVAIVAIGVSLAFGSRDWPAWIGAAAEWMAIALLFLVGALNLRALVRPGVFVLQGWRQRLLPRNLRNATHPLSIIGVGMVFGFVFDTASQAAAWGAAAAAQGGVVAAIWISAAFASGMVLTDTADGIVVARLLRDQSDAGLISAYRRTIGWIIVSLSFGMAAYSVAVQLGLIQEASELLLSALGLTAALGAVTLLTSLRFLRTAARVEG